MPIPALFPCEPSRRRASAGPPSRTEARKPLKLVKRTSCSRLDLLLYFAKRALRLIGARMKSGEAR